MNLQKLCLYLSAPLVLFLSALLPGAIAYATDPFRVLIKDVYLLDPQGTAADTMVDIPVTDHKLDVVTQDDIAPESASFVVDAQSGFLLGSLDLGEQPSFVILAEDPRDNLEVLMDTGSYVQLAMEEGTVIRNSLPAITTQPVGERPKRSGWLSYEPPPMAVPLD